MSIFISISIILISIYIKIIYTKIITTYLKLFFKVLTWEWKDLKVLD